ncbi:MAG TPA: hypothetical protein VM450_16890, partial [Thermomicrobiales bacterium]|nr:hypothetical protein [Thermomicrobiales bacterium]
YSSGRESGTVEVDVAERRHVRKIKGGGPGMVTYRNEHTIAVRSEARARPMARSALHANAGHKNRRHGKEGRHRTVRPADAGRGCGR